MSERPWLAAYPAGVPTDIDPGSYPSLVDLMEQAFQAYATRSAYSYMGKDISFGEVDRQSRAFAAYFQSLGMQPGERVAIMMPNVPQYPIAVAAILRAGFVVVNVNPLYTARELEHQLKDSGATAIVILENFAHTLAEVLPRSGIRHICLTAMGDLLGPVYGRWITFAVRHLAKMVPAFELPLNGCTLTPFRTALSRGAQRSLERPQLDHDSIAFLQYTGGTTGLAKGAVLTHRNIIAATLQAEAWFAPAYEGRADMRKLHGIAALPLYHIFAFTVNMMLSMHTGGKNILIPNPRDLAGTLKELARHKFHNFPAVNTLFNGLAHHPDFGAVDWSHLKVSVGGGMAVQGAVAKLWLEKTGCPIVEGYGLSETSPVVSCNPVTAKEFTGSIGVPLPSTYVKLVGDDGQTVTEPGKTGEIAVKGPQVMEGYWQRPDETAKSTTADGYFLTGDIGTIDERSFIKIVDRKKDMILVSGFNVYPNEVEDVVAMCPGVLECAVVGVPDEKSGEAVKLVVVKKDDSLTEEVLRKYCRENMTGYKQPRVIEFRTELPKTPVGKILRRELR